jgi:hypothetical protein
MVLPMQAEVLKLEHVGAVVLTAELHLYHGEEGT